MRILVLISFLIGFIIFFGNTQVVITLSDVGQWEGGTYIEFIIPERNDSIPEINVSIGENVIWDFNLSDTMSSVPNTEAVYRALNSNEQIEYPNATNIEILKEGDSISTDSAGWPFALTNNTFISLGTISYRINAFDHFIDTTFTFPMQYGDTQVKYNVPIGGGIIKKLSRSFNSFGKFIMPDREEVDVIGFREEVVVENNNKDWVSYRYLFYSKECGRICEISLQGVTDTTLFTAGNTYNMKSLAQVSLNSVLSINLMKSKIITGMIHDPFSKKDTKWVFNTKHKQELFKNRIYNLLGQQIGNPSNTEMHAGVFLRYQENGNFAKAIVLE